MAEYVAIPRAPLKSMSTNLKVMLPLCYASLTTKPRDGANLAAWN